MRAAGYLLAALPYALGYVVGFVVKLVKLVRAAVLEGFNNGSKV